MARAKQESREQGKGSEIELRRRGSGEIWTRCRGNTFLGVVIDALGGGHGLAREEDEEPRRRR